MFTSHALRSVRSACLLAPLLLLPVYLLWSQGGQGVAALILLAMGVLPLLITIAIPSWLKRQQLPSLIRFALFLPFMLALAVIAGPMAAAMIWGNAVFTRRCVAFEASPYAKAPEKLPLERGGISSVLLAAGAWWGSLTYVTIISVYSFYGVNGNAYDHILPLLAWATICIFMMAQLIRANTERAQHLGVQVDTASLALPLYLSAIFLVLPYPAAILGLMLGFTGLPKGVGEIYSIILFGGHIIAGMGILVGLYFARLRASPPCEPG